MINKAGTYKARASEVMLGESKTKGTPFVGVMFTISEGEFAGQKVKWEGWLTDRTAERVIESLQHCGWTGDDLSVFAKGLNGIDRNEVDLVVELEEYDGKEYPKVQWVNRAGSGGGRFSGESMNVAKAAAFGQRFRGVAMAVKAKAGAPKSQSSRTQQGGQQGFGGAADDDIPF